MRTWERSRALLERARQSLTGGVSSPFRAKCPVPLYFEDGSGSRLRDVDGNEYIDYTLAWGPLILGHRHPRVVEAVSRQACRPHIYGAQHELEFLVSERIQSLVPCAERVAYTSSGSEALQIAVRLARAFTGRNVVVKFEGHYHGWIDSLLVSYKPAAEQAGPREQPSGVLGSRGQVPDAAGQVAVAVWNDARLLAGLLDRLDGKAAAVLMEPVLCNSGCLLPEPGYLEEAANLCRRHGALLILDEVITGFRQSLAGAQGFYGVTPDIATFGKAVAGGLPLSVIAGRREIMELMVTGGVAFGGTFNGNPLSIAAADATLRELATGGGAPLVRANRNGARLMDAIRQAGRAAGLPLAVTGFGAAFAVHFTEREWLRDYRDTLDDDRERLNRFLLLALEAGINILPDGRFYVSTAHTEADIDETAEALGRVLGKLAAGD